MQLSNTFAIILTILFCTALSGWAVDLVYSKLLDIEKKIDKLQKPTEDSRDFIERGA